VGFLVNADHRSIIIEMITTLLLGNELESLPTTLGRGVRTKDRSAVTSFVEAMHAHLHSHNAFTRAQALDDTSTRTTIANEHLAEQLDRLIGQAGDLGDKSCRRRRPQWYSIQLVQLRLEISALQHYNNGLMCGKDRTLATTGKLNILQKTPESPLSADPPTIAQLIASKIAIFDQEKAKSAPA
jgi:hypothetical protein